MTIKELYNLAVSKGIEDYELQKYDECGGDYAVNEIESICDDLKIVTL